MMGRSYLKGADGTLFPLLPKVTTVGRENCDFTIHLPGVDYQHCVIEYSDQDDCFVIQDLNTAQGTYVNDVRVQNAAVRLAPGDHIRFGYNGQPFELIIDNSQQPQAHQTHQVHQGYQAHQVPQAHQGSWAQPLQLLSDQTQYTSYSSAPNHNAGLPHINYSTAPQVQPIATWSHQPTSTPPPIPRPPLRSRPLSAGAARRNLPGQQHGPVGPQVARAGQTIVGGWVNQPVTRTTSIPDMQLQEKDTRINQLSDEVTRLRSVEYESFRKDTLIQQLQQQTQDMQQRARQEPSVIMGGGGGDVDMSARLLHLESEVTAKKGEITILKEQLNKLTSDRSGSPQLLRNELAERLKEVTQLRSELDRVKKDKSITSGLVTTMQRDMGNKDSTISKLTREIEVLKKDIRERDIQMTASAKRGKDSPKKAEDDAREKELVTLRQKFKTFESKAQEQLDIISGLREELDKSKAQLFSEKDAQRKLQTDVDTAKSQVTDITRSERVVRVDLEQSQKRMERFRGRIIQASFTSTGAMSPDKEMSDDDLLEAVKKLLDERVKLMGKVKESEDQISKANKGTDELVALADKLKNELNSSMECLTESGRLCSVLTQASALVESLSTDDRISWIRDLVKTMLDKENAWEGLIEAQLESCGVNVKISTDDPGKHLALLYTKWESSLGEKERLEHRLDEVTEGHKAELTLLTSNLVFEWEGKLTDAVEKAKLEGEEKLNAAIDEIKLAEGDKRESYLEAERRKISDLEKSLEMLRNSMSDMQSTHHSEMSGATAVMEQMDELKRRNEELAAEVTRIEALRLEEAGQLAAEKAEIVSQCSSEMNSFREQIRQHSVTICTLEERLEKSVKKNKDLMDKLKHAKPSPPPKPKVIVQRPREELAALEQVVQALRQESSVLKKEVRDSQDVIMGLRRDLAGASARLSDISGEMSEAQKQEMERNRELLIQRSSELTELRQQMAKLSKIIDNQKAEIKTLEADLSSSKSELTKYRCSLEENGSHLKLMQDELDREKAEQRKQLDMLDHEGRITSELTSMGAQCRGERHQQIIARQREALAELRTKVKMLETSRPPLPSQDQALQQVVLLKKELAEMRVSQALSEDKVIQGATTSLDREIGKARGMVSHSNAEADMERSAHRETMDALEASEVSYATLLRAMAASLDLEEIDGLRPMAHIPKDEREALIDARERACELLANRIQVLKERIARKDDLLQGYETDLSKLRQSQELASMKTQQVENLANDVRSRAEESQYLRESLNRTRDRLNQEKRLNTAIKQKKTFHLENERSHLGTAPKGHHCPVEDPRAEVKRRQNKETLRRKNYEIKTLRGDLCETEKELYDREKRLVSYENKMSVERAVEMRE